MEINNLYYYIKMEDKNKNETVWSLPQYHDIKKFDNLFKQAKLEYPNEIDYVIHLGLLSSLMEEDKEKKTSSNIIEDDEVFKEN
jgi:hypothetical protein